MDTTREVFDPAADRDPPFVCFVPAIQRNGAVAIHQASRYWGVF